MDRLQPIYDIAELCARKGLTDAVLSPGSRCAPLTLAFTRHKKIISRTISDERSAGFIGLGIAQQTKKPSVLVCTSGTAVYNFAPAIAEAYFSNTPLIVITADRPMEWIAQQDGQTIFQQDIFGKHVKKSFSLPQDYEHTDSRWAINRIMNEAINVALDYPQGPVHINAPFREPLYPSKDRFGFSKNVRVIEQTRKELILTAETKESLKNEWSQFNKVLLVAGQSEYDSRLVSAVEQFSRKHNLPIIGDVLSNLHSVKHLVKHADLFLGQASEKVKKSLQPDLLITFRGSVISKNLKLFLRAYPSVSHWHIQPAGFPADPFQSLTKIIPGQPHQVFEALASFKPNDKSGDYEKKWHSEEDHAVNVLQQFYPQPDLSELELVSEVMRQLPAVCNLHLANSMSVRYANFIGLSAKQKGITVFANRGTSGIDGCTSTAVGHAMTSKVPNILITGDMAFFYDRNAFWNNYPVPDLRVVVLNNHGGIIFNLIDGPDSLPESDEYFVTRQHLTAKKLCEEFGFDYLMISSKENNRNTFKKFFTFDGKTKVLEFESSIKTNKSLVEKLKQKLKKQ